MTVTDRNLTKSEKQKSCRVETIEVAVDTQSHLFLGTSGILIWIGNLSVGCKNAASASHTRIQATALILGVTAPVDPIMRPRRVCSPWQSDGVKWQP
jgi:hypothetical protein